MGRYDILLNQPSPQQKEEAPPPPPEDTALPPAPESTLAPTKSKPSPPRRQTAPSKPALSTKESAGHESMQECMHALMQVIADEIKDLKQDGNQSLSVRVTPDDFRWLRRITNEYNDELNKKFNQGIFIRIGLKFLKHAIKHDPKNVEALLKEIK